MKFMRITPWQQELQQAISHPLDLLRLLELPENLLTTTPRGLRVPRGYVARMRKGDPNDPLLRQVLPIAEEAITVPHFHQDPTADKAAERTPGLLHKYPGRALLITTAACAIHCRYCFRQHYSYPPFQPQLILESLWQDPSITEVILSGGDPLTWTDSRLGKLIDALATIPHLKRLRLHTRLPIVLPERITHELLKHLTSHRLQPIVVVHANHPNEIDSLVGTTLQTLVKSGITVLNQSVLLRGINDNAATLIALNELLFSHQVLPYYLHMLDRVQGAAHFEVPPTTALELLKQLQENLPGYLVPRLVKEIAGMLYKQPFF